MTFDPQAYAPGDVVKLTQTLRVTHIHDDAITTQDVRNRHEVWLVSIDDTVRLEMVKKAARPKPQVGDVLDGAEIIKAQWKRGSVIRCTLQAGLSPIVLFADGKWRDVGGVGSYSFDDINEDATFEVLLVA